MCWADWCDDYHGCPFGHFRIACTTCSHSAPHSITLHLYRLAVYFDGRNTYISLIKTKSQLSTAALIAHQLISWRTSDLLKDSGLVLCVTVYQKLGNMIYYFGRLRPLWPQNKRLHSPRTTDRQHIRQDRWIQKELAFTPTKNATKPNPFKIISLQPTRKENSWETEETMERATVTLETERAKWPDPGCLWWRWWFINANLQARETCVLNM
jgi:hypothetical protein